MRAAGTDVNKDANYNSSCSFKYMHGQHSRKVVSIQRTGVYVYGLWVWPPLLQLQMIQFQMITYQKRDSQMQKPQLSGHVMESWILAMTATATDKIKNTIIENLDMNDQLIIQNITLFIYVIESKKSSFFVCIYEWRTCCLPVL